MPIRGTLKHFHLVKLLLRVKRLYGKLAVFPTLKNLQELVLVPSRNRRNIVCPEIKEKKNEQCNFKKNHEIAHISQNKLITNSKCQYAKFLPSDFLLMFVSQNFFFREKKISPLKNPS